MIQQSEKIIQIQSSTFGKLLWNTEVALHDVTGQLRCVRKRKATSHHCIKNNTKSPDIHWWTMVLLAEEDLWSQVHESTTECLFTKEEPISSAVHSEHTLWKNNKPTNQQPLIFLSERLLAVTFILVCLDTEKLAKPKSMTFTL